MKISKSYLKQIIKEELQNLTESITTTIKMSPDDFLALTTTPEIMTDIEKRYDNVLKTGDDPFKKTTHKPHLKVDEHGQVIGHEGRLRSYILKQKGQKLFDVDIISPSGFDVFKPNLMLFGQLDKEVSVTLNKSTEQKHSFDDLLNAAQLTRDDISSKLRKIINNLSQQISKQDAVEQIKKELNNYEVALINNPDKVYNVTLIGDVAFPRARVYSGSTIGSSDAVDPFRDKLLFRKKSA
jgi:Mg2+ and Co2+ transporter CorA